MTKTVRLTSAERLLRRTLKELRDAVPEIEGLVYKLGYDFVLRHGKFYPPRPTPKNVKPGAPRCCFGNALYLAVKRGWSYVEGYAFGTALGVPIHHGWVVRPDGRLVDNTWGAHGQAYMGVAFSLGRADDATWFGDATVLDDWKRDWPLFRQEWQGEPDKEWPQSPAVRAILTGDLKLLSE